MAGIVIKPPDPGTGTGLNGRQPRRLSLAAGAAAIARWRAREGGPGPLPEVRCYGRLEAITDSEQRSLRSIVTTAYEAASRTDELLVGLIAVPGVRIFHGVRTVGADLPLIPHAISAGRKLVLIESVAWPPGHYQTTVDGRICCDNVYIGQSVHPFLAAVQQWRNIVPKGHQVGAMIIVHAGADGDISLPVTTADELAWVRAEDAVGDIRQRLASRHRTISRYLLATLRTATEDR
jgi:hypothetical protein